MSSDSQKTIRIISKNDHWQTRFELGYRFKSGRNLLVEGYVSGDAKSQLDGIKEAAANSGGLLEIETKTSRLEKSSNEREYVIEIRVYGLDKDGNRVLLEKEQEDAEGGIQFYEKNGLAAIRKINKAGEVEMQPLGLDQVALKDGARIDGQYDPILVDVKLMASSVENSLKYDREAVAAFHASAHVNAESIREIEGKIFDNYVPLTADIISLNNMLIDGGRSQGDQFSRLFSVNTELMRAYMTSGVESQDSATFGVVGAPTSGHVMHWQLNWAITHELGEEMERRVRMFEDYGRKQLKFNKMMARKLGIANYWIAALGSGMSPPRTTMENGKMPILAPQRPPSQKGLYQDSVPKAFLRAEVKRGREANRRIADSKQKKAVAGNAPQTTKSADPIKRRKRKRREADRENAASVPNPARKRKTAERPEITAAKELKRRNREARKPLDGLSGESRMDAPKKGTKQERKKEAVRPMNRMDETKLRLRKEIRPARLAKTADANEAIAKQAKLATEASKAKTKCAKARSAKDTLAQAESKKRKERKNAGCLEAAAITGIKNQKAGEGKETAVTARMGCYGRRKKKAAEIKSPFIAARMFVPKRGERRVEKRDAMGNGAKGNAGIGKNKSEDTGFQKGKEQL